jgi:predicted amidohydrolase YtcJ
VEQLFFYNFSGRNAPDYSHKDFDSMLVMNGTILKTGYQLPFPAKGPNVKAVDLKGATVFAGLSDAHVHLVQTGLTHTGFDLSQAESLTDIFALTDQALQNAELALGFNLQEHRLKNRKLPTLEELDKLSSDKLIWLSRKDLHSAVINSCALKWARKFIPDLAHENGLIKGNCYYELVYRLIGEIPDKMLLAGMQKTAQNCFAKGVTCIHALEGSPESSREAELAASFFKHSPLEGVVYHQSPRPDFAKQNGFTGFGGCLLVDGSFGTRTAALNDPYSDSSETSGNLYLDATAIEELLTTAHKAQLQLAVHAIGDRALDVASSCYARARNKFGPQKTPNRIEHFILPGEKAIKAARSSEALICIQPVFDYLWGGPNGLYAQRLGKKRAKNCNPFKTLLDLGIPLACGSDSPVTEIDPILGIHALLNHSNPDERLPLNCALPLFISEPHQFIGKHSTRGQLKPGFKADFICLSEDPFLVAASKFKDLKVCRTFINGEEVFKAAG